MFVSCQLGVWQSERHVAHFGNTKTHIPDFTSFNKLPFLRSVLKNRRLSDVYQGPDTFAFLFPLFQSFEQRVDQARVNRTSAADDNVRLRGLADNDIMIGEGAFDGSGPGGDDGGEFGGVAHKRRERERWMGPFEGGED